MKSIEQLLQLTKNPHYTFTPEETERINDFLAQQQQKRSKKSRKKSSKKSSDKTPVNVKNVVEKVDTYAPDARTVS